MRFLRSQCVALALILGSGLYSAAQQPWTWDRIRAQFDRNNPTLRAGQLAVQESRANEVSANLRPNPQLNLVLDEFTVFNPDVLDVNNAQWTSSVTQLIERQSKRHLRFQSAQLATSQVLAGQTDLERSLLFNLRDAFIRVLAAKSVVQLATDNLAYYDRVIGVNRDRYQAGDISKIDLSRVELQRAQFESDFQSAQVNLRQAKLDLLSLMNEKTPADEFDVAGDFDFRDSLPDLSEVRQAAVETRPDLKAAATAVERSRVDHKLAWANGSTDPVVGMEYQRNGPFNTIGMDFAIPLRLFDRNQGEKQRTQLEIERSQRLEDGVQLAVLRDVGAAHASLASVVALLRPYRDHYLPEATEVRDTISFSYAHGGASLLDFLDAQREYRDAQLNYRNLIASYMSAVNQLNFTVGREVLP